MKIFCIGIASGKITEKLTDVLFVNSHDMIEYGEEFQAIKSSTYEGCIKTKFNRATLGTISGIVFEADIMTDKGQVLASYLIRDQDLDGIEKRQVKIHRFEDNE